MCIRDSPKNPHGIPIIPSTTLPYDPTRALCNFQYCPTLYYYYPPTHSLCSVQYHPPLCPYTLCSTSSTPCTTVSAYAPTHSLHSV
eukprot:180022-Rhodomonas_salina.1